MRGRYRKDNRQKRGKEKGKRGEDRSESRRWKSREERRVRGNVRIRAIENDSCSDLYQ